MRGRSRTSIGSPTPCSTARLRSGSWSTMRVKSAHDMSAGGSSASKVRGQVSHSKLQRFVTSRYTQSGGAVASTSRAAAMLSK